MFLVFCHSLKKIDYNVRARNVTILGGCEDLTGTPILVSHSDKPL